MVIISASGMAEAGRILHHLKNNIENPRNTVLIVGWQAPDTLGRQLEEHDKQVRIFGALYEVPRRSGNDRWAICTCRPGPAAGICGGGERSC